MAGKVSVLDSGGSEGWWSRLQSWVTKARALGAPGKVSHSHLRELLPRDSSLFLNSCLFLDANQTQVVDPLPNVRRREEGNDPGPMCSWTCFFKIFFTVSTQDYLRTRLHHMVLRVTVLLRINISASLGTSRTAVLPLCTLISMSD